MIESIHAEYEQRRAQFAEEFASSTARSRLLTQALLIVLCPLVYLAFARVPAWWILLPAITVVALIAAQLRARSAAHRATRLLSIYELAVARADGTRTQSGHTGEAFVESGHLYERDLNILGHDSIFGMLATTRTAVGQRALARLLLHGADAEKVHARQAAVRELAPLLDLRERVALLGRSAFDELPAETFDRWLSQPLGGLAVWMRWVLLGITTFAALLLVGVLSHRLDGSFLPRNIAALLALQVAFTLWLRPGVRPELEGAQRLAGQTAILRDGLQLLQQQNFESQLLRQLQQDAIGEEQALKSLERTLTLVEQRSKEWYYVPALLLAIGTHAAISLEAWKRQHGEAMRQWIAAWASFEAMLAFATYAAEHPENVYPTIVEGAASFTAEGLAHPLLPASKAVANNVQLNSETRFLLISGSNMAGKSTLLRAIGCNVVLALAGAPVCARSATMTALQVGASLALVDSLAEGKSKFLAEVERLRDLVALAREGQALFLIDEIFSGTNSADRRAAAEAVLRGLIREGAIGALSTHDLALTELAEMPELSGRNVHMASPDESDPLGFDYLLKPGVNRTTNALAIVKMLGLAD
jgi:hypothetical protein